MFLYGKMPYDIKKDHPDCPASKPYGVVKEDDGKLMGCHESKAKAQKQIAAIYVSESKSETETENDRSEPMSEQLMYYTRALVDLGEGEIQQRQAKMHDLLENPDLPVPFVASTEGVKADGINLKMKDWDLTRFANYGPVMWVHNYWHPPLGTGVAEASDKLRMNVHYDRDDDFAMLIRGKAIKGMMAGSVGWVTREDGKNELIEFSMTPLGLDPDALPDIKRMSPTALRTISKFFEEDGSGMAEAIQELREEIMGEMKGLLAEWLAANEVERMDEEEECDPEKDPDCEPKEEMEHTEEEPEDERLLDAAADTAYMYYDGRVYIPTTWDNSSITWVTETTENADGITWYRILPSEVEEVEKAEDSLEDMLQRAGAVLSKKNRDDLRKALELITGVIDRATPEDEFFASLDEERNEDIDIGREEESEQRQEPTPEVLNQIKKVLEGVES